MHITMKADFSKFHNKFDKLEIDFLNSASYCFFYGILMCLFKLFFILFDILRVIILFKLYFS